MELYVDIADLDTIQAIADYFPIDGFTTNPKLLSVQHPMPDIMSAYQDYVQTHSLKIFMQVTADTAEEMLEQAKILRAYYGSSFVVKLPAVKEGYKAIRLCKAKISL